MASFIQDKTELSIQFFLSLDFSWKLIQILEIGYLFYEPRIILNSPSLSKAIEYEELFSALIRSHCIVRPFLFGQSLIICFKV